MRPGCVFSVVADCQYANMDNTNVEGRTQRYREAPGKLRKAVDFIKQDVQGRPELFFLHLGDFLQGRQTEAETLEDLETVSTICDDLAPLPVYHVIGNHDLAFPREHFIRRGKLPSSYYTVKVCEGWRLIVLDTTEMSPHSGYQQDSAAMCEMRAYQESHPISEHVQMSDWNGGCTTSQVSWLRSELAAAEQAGERVIVASHHPIGGGCARATHMAWNCEELQAVLAASPAVVLCLSGHDHEGGYSCINGKHFITLEAMLEAPPDSNAFAIVELHDDMCTIEGHGTVTSRKLPLPHKS